MQRIVLASLVCVGLVACSGGDAQKKESETPTEGSAAPAESTESTESDSAEATADESADAAAEAESADAESAEAASPEVDLANTDPAELFTVSGIEKQTAAGVIGQKKDDVYACYKEALADHPHLKGRVLVEITASNAGDVMSAIVSQSTLEGQAKLEACITNKIRKWKFPASEAGLMTIQYAFVLPP